MILLNSMKMQLDILKKRKIKTYLVSAVFKNRHAFFKWYGGIFRKSLSSFELLMVQDKFSEQLLNEIQINNTKVCGDTRFDRVLEVKKKFSEIELIKQFKGDNKLIIAGSTWSKDEDLVLDSFMKIKNEKIKLLIAPHEVNEKSVSETEKKLKERKIKFELFSKFKNENSEVLVLNTIGVLARSYAYADAAYIGGGFNEGLHNVLEASVWSVPVLFYA